MNTLWRLSPLQVPTGLTLALGALIGACALSRTSPLDQALGPLRVEGRSVRPLAEESVWPSPGRAELNLPGAPAPSHWAVVQAASGAPVPAEVPSRRVARLCALQDARVAAMTRGLRQLAHWNTSDPSRQLDREEMGAALAQAVQIHETPDRIHASIVWSPPGAGAVETGPGTPSMRDEMEREAEEDALGKLREILLETEVAAGVTLHDRLARHHISGQTLEELLARAEVVRAQHGVDADRAQRVCEIELEFDLGWLRPLP